MNKTKFYKIHKLQPINDFTENQVVHVVTKSVEPIYLGAFLGKDIKEYTNNKVTFVNGRFLLNVELCGSF